jgi:hypothetical protein
MSKIKQYIPKRLLPAVMWFRNGPMTDMYTVLLVVFPWLGVFLRFLRKAIVVGFWINEKPYKNSYSVDLRRLGNNEQDILKNFTVLLQNLINKTNNSIHLSVDVPSEFFKLVTDLQGLTKTIPQSQYGDVEFYLAKDDRKHWQSEITSNRDSVTEYFDVTERNVSKKLIPPAHYLNAARAFLKTFGAHRKVYFCNFESARTEFFEQAKDLQQKGVFLVNTPIPVAADLHYKYGNVIYLSRLGLSTAEKIALVQLCDAYLGLDDALNVFAKQRGVQVSEPSQVSRAPEAESLPM